MLPTLCRTPYERPSWLSYSGPVDTCANFVTDPGGSYRRHRCGADLSQAEPEPPDEPTLAAQRWLLEIVAAAANRSTVTAIGLPVDPSIAYGAAAEIITENLATEQTSSAPEKAPLGKAHLILSQADLKAAGRLTNLVRGFEPHAGVAPLERLAAYRRPRNPLLVAISLQQHQGHLSYGSELKFRVGTAAARYPTAWKVTSPPLTQAAAQPEVPMAWIPAGLWNGAITLGIETDAQLGIDTDIGRAFAALALAKFGSVRPWRYLAINLGLPAGLAVSGAKHWKAIDSAGLWPAYVTTIGNLFERLHNDPPPIDYERRRVTAQPALVLREARRALANSQVLALAIEQHTYASALWSTYTGGNSDHAPAEIRATIQPPHLAIPQEALTDSALQLGKPKIEPLVWRPP
jgi:hypothetical protein